MIRRLTQLLLGLLLYGFSLGLMIEGSLGAGPWDVFHQGLAEQSGLSLGTVLIIVGAAVLLLWIPLRQRPGIGTISNIVVVGLATDLSLWLLPDMNSLPLSVGMMLAAILLNGVAGGAYIGAGLGPGPRDGLMTGLVRRTGWSVRVVRTMIEVSVLALGWALGGTLGIGTLLYAVGIGPIVHLMLPIFTIPEKGGAGSDQRDASDRASVREERTA